MSPVFAKLEWLDAPLISAHVTTDKSLNDLSVLLTALGAIASSGMLFVPDRGVVVASGKGVARVCPTPSTLAPVTTAS